MTSVYIGLFIFTALALAGGGVAYWQYRRVVREAKNYERGLKMVPLLIHLPPSSDDIQGGGRDERDVTEETISQSQVMYNIIASTVTKGFKSKVYGQRHVSFEMTAHKGLIHYYVVVPMALLDVVRQAVAAAYPAARLEEVETHNIFSKVGKVSGTIGGELTLKKDYSFPIATFQESKRDAMRAILNALAATSKEDGAAIQILVRPAPDGWSKRALAKAGSIRKDKGKGGSMAMKDVAGALWKAPEAKDVKPEDKQLSSVEQSVVDAIEDKTRYPGYEVLIRIIASSNTANQSQAVLKNIVASFALFDAPNRNGFKFSITKNVEEFITSYILRFFPQQVNQSVLNSVELATIFHLPDQKNIPTSQVERQMSKQVDGPNQTLDEGFLLGYNVYRGVKKQIRLAQVDRRRHTYIIGQTGTGKSGLLENLALQDMLDGKGFAFVDPHGDSVEKLMGMVPKERVEDVIYFSPGDMDNPVGLNLFEYESRDQRDFLVQEAIAMLYRLYDPGHTGIIGPRYEHWFRNAALTIMSDPAGTSFIDIPQVFNDNEFAKEKIKHVTDQTVLDFWNKEMAQTSDYHKSEVLGWFVSKFGAFLSNEMMRNVIGQTKSGFNLRDIMDNKKILLVNLSKGKTGELNSQLLGMIFVMKFQAAAMGRADIPEDERVDFSLYVDEFQNFATDSFENILSEARKYRLNLILANQFMTQLTDKIREAIIGNVGTIISGRIGTTDAELMQKKFSPTFDAEDLTKLPNYETVASVMINNVPSAPFSMALVPPLGKPNPQLAIALKKLSAAKYGQPRAKVEQAIFERLRAGDKAREDRKSAILGGGKDVAATSASAARPLPGASSQKQSGGSAGSSFLDDWLAKRKQIQQQKAASPQPPIPAKAPVLAPKSAANPEPTVQSSAKAVQLSQAQTATPDEPKKVDSIADDAVKHMQEKLKEVPDEVKTPAVAKPKPSAEVTNIHALPAVDVNVVTPKKEHASMSTEDQLAAQQLVEARLPKAPQDTLSIQRDSSGVSTPASGLEEIYVDVRGNLHHRSEEATNSSDDSTKKPA